MFSFSKNKIFLCVKIKDIGEVDYLLPLSKARIQNPYKHKFLPNLIK